MTTVAQQIVEKSANSTEAMEYADHIKNGDQNWDDETTQWFFDDGSVLVVSGPDYYAEGRSKPGLDSTGDAKKMITAQRVNEKYTIELACDTTEADGFCAWLNGKGHSATMGNSTGDYVDGAWTSTDRTANEIMRVLWESYCNGE